MTTIVHIYSGFFRFAGGRVPAVCWSWSCVRCSPDNHMHAHTYTRTYTHARGFLDSGVIFRLFSLS